MLLKRKAKADKSPSLNSKDCSILWQKFSKEERAKWNDSAKRHAAEKTAGSRYVSESCLFNKDVILSY